MSGTSALGGRTASRIPVVDDDEAVRLGLAAARPREGLDIAAEVAGCITRLDGRGGDVVVPDPSLSNGVLIASTRKQGCIYA